MDSELPTLTPTAKVGGIPVWAIGVGIGLIIIVFVWLNAKKDTNKKSNEPEPATLDEYDLINKDAKAYDAARANPDAEYVTNDAWTSDAAAYLLQKGYSPYETHKTLTRYLQGLSLTPTEKSIVDQAVARFGLPPQGVYGFPDADTPESISTAIQDIIDDIMGRLDLSAKSETELQAQLVATREELASQSGALDLLRGMIDKLTSNAPAGVVPTVPGIVDKMPTFSVEPAVAAADTRARDAALSAVNVAKTGLLNAQLALKELTAGTGGGMFGSDASGNVPSQDTRLKVDLAERAVRAAEDTLAKAEAKLAEVTARYAH